MRGINNLGQTALPASVQSGVIAIAAGNSYGLALKNDGRVVMWGLQTGDHRALTPPPPPPQHTVTIVNNSGLALIPAVGTFQVYEGDYSQIGIPGQLSPAIEGCSGTLTGTVYQSGPVVADCTITVGLAPPLAIFATDRTSNSFTANWNVASGATGHYLDVASEQTFTTKLPDYDNKDVGNATSYPVSGLVAGTTYWYRLRSRTASETSANSNLIPVPPLPAAPTASAATAITQTGFTANWSPAADIIGYQLFVATDSGFTNVLPAYNGIIAGTTSKAVTGLDPGTTYWYQVKAFNAGGAGATSNSISVMTIPPAPVAISATGQAPDSFTANWNTANGATAYLLDVSSDSSFGSYFGTYHDLEVTGATSAFVSGLTADTTYYYRVRARNAGGVSSYSNTITVGVILTVTDISGNGSGSIHSVPGGIACNTGLGNNCSASFPNGQSVELTALPDWKSLFGTWGGDCTGNLTNTCTLTMSNARNVSASFNPNYQAILSGAPGPGYVTLQDAYSATVDGSTILAHVHIFEEYLLFNSNTGTITLDGGKDPADGTYQTTAGFTTVRGSLTVNNGKLIVRNVKIR